MSVTLNLVPGVLAPLTPYLFANFVFFILPRLVFTLPVHLLWHHILYRRWSPIVQVLGRPFHADAVVQVVRYILARATPAQARTILFDRVRSYKRALRKPEFRGYRDWVSYVDVAGTAGRWVAPPGTARSDDDVVFYYIHGGGFVIDTGGNAQSWVLKIAQEMNLRRGVKFSVFCLDYRLAPDYKYPSQLIEALAGYHYLVNTLGISPSKICIAGDSAGGNLVATFLLHLARPHPSVRVPAELGPTPRRPHSAFLISPWIKLVSTAPSRKSHELFDTIESDSSVTAALDYIGVAHPSGKTFVPSWNPVHWFVPPTPPPSEALLRRSAKAFDSKVEGTGLELLSSPYVNSSVCEDLEWWKEACPGEGRTMICWGGKEIFSDDIEEFVTRLDAAGVAPAKLLKPLGTHDWIIYEHDIAGLYQTKTTGADRELRWGVNALAAFLEGLCRPGQFEVEKLGEK